MPPQCGFGLGVDHHQVGVGADGDDALFRIDAVHPGRVLREHAGERYEIDPAPVYRLVIEQRERIGNLVVHADAAVPEIAALLEARGIGETVGSDHRKCAILDPAPQTLAILLETNRRLNLSLSAGVLGVHLGSGGREEVGERFAHDWKALSLERSNGVDALRGADMHRVQRASELIGDESVGVNLYTLRPLRTALGPRREMVAPTQPPEFVDQDPTHERILGVDHREHRPPRGVDGAAGLVEEGRAYSLFAHAEALGLRAIVAGKELVRDTAVARHRRNLLDLVERVNHAGDLEVTPTA